MHQSTDHLSNVMAQLVMSSVIKATLKKCKEQWHKQATFHEEDIQQKLELLESVWLVCSINTLHDCTVDGCVCECECIIAALAQAPQPA